MSDSQIVRVLRDHGAQGLLGALEGIAGMAVDESTNHKQLSALCIAMARIALAKVRAETNVQ